jgi:hypothetical protein
MVKMLDPGRNGRILEREYSNVSWQNFDLKGRKRLTWVFSLVVPHSNGQGKIDPTIVLPFGPL